MKELPIVFTAESIRAILNGQKTMTRRIINPQPEWKEPEPGNIVSAGWEWKIKNVHLRHFQTEAIARELPRYSKYTIGDHLWVKEVYLLRDCGRAVIYKADLESIDAAGFAGMYGGWKTPRFMPKKFARIWLELTNIRAEQLHDITEGDIIKEGCPNEYLLGRSWYMPEWDKLNTKRKGGIPWHENPWVEVKEFKLLEAK